MLHTPPLVVGYPRTGFTLLISVIIEIFNHARIVKVGHKSLKAFCDGAGMQIAANIEKVFERHGITNDLIYNENFRQMVGGPKWLGVEAEKLACFRKYIGVRGKGDFTLITSHPRQVLEYDEIIHSHDGPAVWAAHPAYADYGRFASVRNPAGTVASACFSLNALSSEYIQRFIPSERDNDRIRQSLALYKLSDLNFFEALLKPFRTYLEEFDACADDYFVMRWEDLIQNPEQTIGTIAKALGIMLDPEQATEIWARIGHINLTGAHKHNFRQGYGIVGEWKKWLTNTHIDMMRDYGLDRLSKRYGYDILHRFNECEYTQFQRKLADAISNGDIIREFDDDELFGFAFNKSNIELDHFNFKRYDWRKHSRIERSSCTDDDLVMEVWDVAEESCELINSALNYWFEEGAAGSQAQKKAAVELIASELALLFSDSNDLFCWKSIMLSSINEEDTNGVYGTGFVNALSRPKSTEPVLMRSVGTTNVVEFQNRYYAVPQALGSVNFHDPNVGDMPGVRVADDLLEILNELSDETN
jgi:hypothetical protein